MRWLLAAFVLLGCAGGVQKRIDSERAAFDASPADVQKDIREGRIRPGFTEDQVFMALGRPDHKGKRTSVGSIDEVWVYAVGSARVRPGIGLSIGTGGRGYGGGISFESRSRDEDQLRVLFREGKVLSIEEPQK